MRLLGRPKCPALAVRSSEGLGRTFRAREKQMHITHEVICRLPTEQLNDFVGHALTPVRAEDRRGRCRKMLEAPSHWRMKLTFLPVKCLVTPLPDQFVQRQSGYFSRSLAVYGQSGQPCPRCGTEVVREAFMNRSSYFCPHCQPVPRKPRVT